MAWFKVDDRLWSHPKWIHLPIEAKAMWISAGSYCAQHETDGYVSRQTLAIVLPNSRQTRAANALVEARLWDTVEGGYIFRNWDEYQPTKAQRDAERSATRERVAKHRNAKRNGVTNGVSNGRRTGAPTRPDPTPISTNVDIQARDASETHKKRDTGYTEDFQEFWKIYPRKAGKAAAFKEWAKALEATSPEALIAAARSYAEDPNRVDAYTAHPRTWLSQGRWDDEPLPPRSDYQDKSLEAARRDLARYTDPSPAGTPQLQIAPDMYPWEATR